MSVFTVVEHPGFKADLRSVVARDPTRAEEILTALEAASLLLRRFPELGHPVQVNGVWSMIRRSWAVGETGYLISYRVEREQERIVLMRFRHEAQRPLKR